MMTVEQHISRVRKLYKLIFRIHRGLPAELRLLGDNYARDEFKRHKQCNMEEARIFLNEWTKYKKQMTRDEVSYFTDLVKEKSAIHSKATNAFQNQLKEIAWTEVTDAYNARFGRVPKNKQQLKLKWDNLKKMARKRLQLIRYNNLKTGGGKPICIPVDEILDKVAELLGSTGSGFEVPFGGDGTENKENESIVLEEDNSEVATTEPPNQESVPGPSTEKKQKHEDVPTIQKPISKRLFQNAKKKKDNDGRLQKKFAIAKYFEKKTEKLELEIKLLKTEISNLRDTNNK